MSLTLQRAIENLYSAFSSYPWSHRAGCPCCHTQEDVAPLRDKKLAELSAEDLSSFADSALLTWGTIDDFRHFLPRIFELCTECYWYPYPHRAVKSLRYGKWQEWPPLEQKAVIDFCDAWWHTALDSYGGPVPLDAILPSLAAAYEDVTPLLNYWRSLESEAAFRHFTDSWDLAQSDGFLMKEQKDQCHIWLCEPATKIWLESGYYKFLDKPWADEFVWAIEILETRIELGKIKPKKIWTPGTKTKPDPQPKMKAKERKAKDKTKRIGKQRL